MITPRIIGLGHMARSGKDSVGDWLVKEHGFKKTAFAESLKEACRVLFHLTDEQLYGEHKEDLDGFWGTTPREIMQRFGTEAMRNNFQEDVWVKSLELRLKMNPNQSWVITDVRFPNEADVIRAWGGKVYCINRPGIENAIATKKHASETSMENYDLWDGVIDNSGSLDDLYKEAANVININPTSDQTGSFL